MSLGSAADKALVVGAPVGAVTAPWWMDHLNTAGTTIVLVTAAVVGLCRAYIAIRDVIDRRNGKRD